MPTATYEAVYGGRGHAEETFEHAVYKLQTLNHKGSAHDWIRSGVVRKTSRAETYVSQVSLLNLLRELSSTGDTLPTANKKEPLLQELFDKHSSRTTKMYAAA